MIQLNADYFDVLHKEKIAFLIEAAQPYFDNANALYKRYSRKSDITKLMNGDGITMPYEHYSTNIANGYIAGNAPIFTVADRKLDLEEKGIYGKVARMLTPKRKTTQTQTKEQAEELQLIIDSIVRYNDLQKKYSRVNKNLISLTRGYFYLTENSNNETEIVVFDPRNSVAIYDYGMPPYPVALIRVWVEKNDKNDDEKRIEIITAKSRRIFNEDCEPIPFLDYDTNGELISMTEKLLFWGNPDKGVPLDVPVIPFVDDDNIAIFEPAISLIDSQQTVVTNIDETLRYNIDPKLVIEDDNPPESIIYNENNEPIKNPERIEYENSLIKAKILFTQGEGSKWLVRPIDFSGAIEYLNKSTQYIMMFSGVPNVTDDSFASAQSGVALGYKFYGFDLRCTQYYSIAKEAFLRMWELIINRINFKNRTDYDFRDIDIKFKPNVPQDAEKNAQQAVMLYEKGLISLETAIDIGLDNVIASAEIEKIAREKMSVKTVDNLMRLLQSDPPLITHKQALIMIYGEKQADEIEKNIEELMKSREEFNNVIDEELNEYGQ